MNMLDWWGISRVLQINYSSFRAEWGGLMVNRKWKKLWNLIFGCVIWSIWFERNKVKFESKIPDRQLFIYALKIRICTWAKECLGYSVIAHHDFIHNLGAIFL